MMKLRLATPEHLIDINPLESELGYIREEDGEVRIGALTRHREILESELLARHFPIVRDAEELIADPPVRNRGTIGGALCQADPSEDLSAVCAALGARRRHPRPRRRARRRDGRTSTEGPYETAVGDAEMLVEVRIPLREHGGSAYEKVKRRTGDWATAAAGAALWLDGAEHRRRRHRAQRRQPDERALDPRRGGARRPPAVGGGVRRGRRARRRGLRRRSATCAGPPTTSATSRAS